MNHFAFAASNPLSFTDPSGLGPQGSFAAGRNVGRFTGNLVAGPALGAFDFFTEVWTAYHPFGDPSSSRGISMNGILGDNNANHQATADSSSLTVVFNPSNGFIADIIQSALGIISFGFGDSGARSIGNALSNPQLSLAALNNVVAHSQATIHLTNSLLYSSSPSIQATLNSPAIPAFRSGLISSISGSVLHYNQPSGDIAIPYTSLNPFQVLNSLSNPIRAINIHLGNTHTNLNQP